MAIELPPRHGPEPPHGTAGGVRPAVHGGQRAGERGVSVAVATQLAEVVGRILLRRAARAGRLKGRHSVTDQSPDL